MARSKTPHRTDSPVDADGDDAEATATDGELDELEPADEELSDAEGEQALTGELIDDGQRDGSAEEPEQSASATGGDRRPTTTLAPRQRSLAQRDPLQAYINEARRYPLLSREEEHDLAVRYREHDDIDAARQLVTANLRLVVKIAHEYRKAYRNLLDLVQEGNIGLMHAVKKFDPYRGVKLSSYAAWWIRAYILKFILNNWRLVKIGTTQNQRKLFFNLRKEMEALQQMGVDSPGPKLLAERLDVPVQEVRSMQQRLSGNDVSLDAPVRTEDGRGSRLDFVEAHDAGPEEATGRQELEQLVRERVAEFGKSLSGRDKEIFELRTIADEPLTLQQIGDRYGITRERARQLERRVMDRLRDYLRDELGDSVEVALGIQS